MKKIAIFLLAIVLFSTISYAQQRYDNYFKLWEEVQQFETNKLPKSALVVVERIYAKAKNEGNSPQITKVLLYKSKYALILEEDAQLNIINSFKNEISTAEFPTKNILESVLANLYWQYFQQNRYKFYNRTKTTEKVDVADFRTWDLQTLFKEIHHHFQSSLRNGLVSQQTDLLKFNAILELQKDSKKYRPTLFDFLSHNALDFYKTSETSISSPAYKFELTKDDFFAHIKFSGDKSYRFQTEKDSLSLQLNALKIYQNLIAFHKRNNNSDALVTVVLERLKFVKKHATFSDKDDLFLTMLKELKEAHKSAEASTLVDFEIAAVFNNEAATYHHINNTEHQFDRTKALDICNDAIHKFPKSLGAEKCKILKQQIKSKTLTITAEKNISIQKHSKLLLSYKNVEKLYFNIYKIDEKGAAKFSKIYKDAAKVEFIKKLDFITSFNESLKTENDYQQHQTEIVIPPLNNGKYLIYVSTFETLNSNSVHATSIIQVTDIVVVEDKQNNTTIYQVVNRNTGKPLIGATVTIKNYNTGRYNKPINRNYISDKNGQLKFKTTNSYRNVVLTVSYNNEIASFGDYYISEHRNYNKLPDKVTIHPFLFTDRSIYRPGQTVYFKGIFIENEGLVSAPFSKELVSAALYNVNYEKIEELELETNEFGAVSGAFILPNNGLLGQYSINVKAMGLVNKNFYFSVEEYKRPKFETDFKPVTATYRINDSIRIEGNAIAYAGSNISNAKVVYRVHRKVQYPRWYYWYRPNFISSEAQEITHGETITDDRGNFNITFKAIPDKSVNKEDLPIFIYEVTADVTDINGETRSASADVKVGYHTLTAQVTIAEKIDKNNKENTLSVETKNLNNEVISAKGMLRIFKLTAPENVLRKRPWNAPDYQTLSKSAFNNLFPHEAYSNEDEIRNWQKGALVFESTFDTSKSTNITLKRIKKWLSGKYIVELEAKDKFDQIVTDKQVFSVFSEEEDYVADKLLFIISTNKANYKPNEKVVLKIGSASKDLYVTMEVEKHKKIIDTKIIHLNNEVKQIEIPVYEKDLGGFVIHYSFTNFNSFKSGSLAISVPYPINELEIETSTFRDKLQPGQNETWSFKLKGNKGDKIAAELLASMYDASLDQFKLHNWQFNPIQKPIYYSYNNKRAHQSFGNEHFSVKNLSKFYPNYPQQYFDRLDWFGFSFGNNGMFYALRGKIAGIESKRMNDQIEINEDDEEVEEVAFSTRANLDEIVVTGIEKKEQTEDTTEETYDMSSVKIRKNFNETAFFYPHLKTDANGNVSFNFTVPEALTLWKLQLLAHTKELASATKTLTTVTQKELMVLPNPPRFLREGDQIVFSSKISNMSAKNLSGAAILELTDAITGKDITVEMSNRDSIGFIVDANGNTNVSWSFQVPDDVQAIQYKIIAKAEDFSDGEQNVLPVLSNRMLVTETLPMWVRSSQTKTFTLDKLINNT